MALSEFNTIRGSLDPMPDVILAIDMDNGDHLTKSGLIITDDNGKDRGIRPRWATVYRVGENVTDVKSGDHILVEHGRWTHIIEVETDGVNLKVQRIDPKGIWLVADTRPDRDMYTKIY